MHRLIAISVAGAALAMGPGASTLVASGSNSDPVTKPEAVAFAKAVNLRKGDLAGADGGPTSGGALVVGQGAQCAGSPGDVSAPAVYDAATYLESRHALLISVIRVTATEALAAADLAKLASPQGRACFVSSLPDRLRKEPKTFVSFQSVAEMLGPGATRIRIRRPHGKTHIDENVFRVGSAEISLLAFGTPRALPATVERHILSLLHGRAEAHRL